MKRDWELMGRIFTAIEEERLNALLGGYEWEEDEVTGEKKQPSEYVRIIKKIEKLDAVYNKCKHELLTDEKLYNYAKNKWITRSTGDNPPATAS